MSKKKKKKGGLEKKVLSHFIKDPKKSYSYRQLLKLFGSKGEDKQDILSALDVLVAENKITLKKDRTFRLVSQRKNVSSHSLLVEGKLDVTSSGNAYLVSDKLKDDVYIHSKNLNRGLDGDTVKAELFDGKRRKKEGKVVEIVERATETFVGIIQVSSNYAFLIPDGKKAQVDIFIPKENTGGAKSGEKVLVELVNWKEGQKSPTGKVISVLGKPGLNDVEMQSILAAHGFPLEFPKKVMDEVNNLPVAISEEEISKRRDYRDVTTFTIDPHDAKDFDDALSLQKLSNGHWEVGVHIADVSHYAQPGSQLDTEAQKRSTSVYLVDRVLPMFPEKLSNIICSLRPEEDKLCYACVFEMDDQAVVRDYWIGRTVIHSDKRFTYEEAQEVIEGKSDGPFKDEILTMDRLSKILRKKRFEHGAINFDSSEVKFKFDQNGKPIDVYQKVRKDSNLMIEDFMLLANRKVAEWIGKKAKDGDKIPMVYRVHDQPDIEKLLVFKNLARVFDKDLDMTSRESIGASLNKLMADVKGTPQQNLFEYLAVRTMSKAIYTTKNIGHYGLAFDDYTHFTSPIRRYPDVLAHRVLTSIIKKKKRMTVGELEPLLDHSSRKERKAVEAERAANKYKQVEFMLDKIGEEFDGVISGVTRFGIFVELIANKVEGLVRTDDLPDDRYLLDEKSYTYMGINTGRKFQLGDEVRIKVVAADMDMQTVDFWLAETEDD